jgi:membrane fusion protein, multidrug efflux system
LAPCTMKAKRGAARILLFLPAIALLLVGCKQETKTEAPQPRPVRTVTAEKSEIGQSVVLTGQIQAEKETALAFRIGGRIIERSAGVMSNPIRCWRNSRAGLSAAQGKLVQVRNTFQRQETLLSRGFTTKVLFDQAQQGLRTAQAQVDDAKAQLETPRIV